MCVRDLFRCLRRADPLPWILSSDEPQARRLALAQLPSDGPAGRPVARRAAIDAAEPGHLVISSMRTTDPADTVTRLISMFPDSQQPVVRYQLATQIQAIISQLLVETSNGGRIMACEVLTNNERAQEWVIAAEEAAVLVDIIKESSFHGMQTFDQALLKHVVERTVDIGAVLPYVRNTHEIRAKAMAAGIAS
jgi:twitching motility protein PilT